MNFKSAISKFLYEGGVKVPHCKHTANFPTEKLPVPDKVYIPMSQHIGAPCKPCVQKGDYVYVGTKIGEAPVAMSMNIYSSVSGTVESIGEVLRNTGKSVTMITIKSDGKQEVDPSIAPPDVHDLESFISALGNSGIVGLGGAGFPTDVKMLPKNLSDIDTLVINGAECEPYLTTDNREMLEHPQEIIYGIESVQKYLGIEKAILCIEENKPEAIDVMTKMLEKKNDNISVCVLESRYPQGAELLLIKNATGRVVPRGQLPASVGVIVQNVTTISSIGKFLKTGMPLVNKRLTVDGDIIAFPRNIEVAIGTPLKVILDYCQLKDTPGKIIVGGPMMGSAQMDTDYPITRQNNGLLAFSKAKTIKREETACIRCGRCVNSCPMGLSPVDIENSYEKYDADALRKLMADVCIGCGTCSYVCPAKRPLTQSTTLAKAFLRSR